MAVELAAAYVSLTPSFRGGAAAIARELDAAVKPAAAKASRSMADAFAGKGDTIAAVGQTLTTHVSAPLAGIGGLALKMGGDFEFAMNGVRAVTGATGDDFEQLRSLAKKMGADTQFSASEAANAMEFLGMAGFSTSEILASLPDVLALAAAGNTDLATTADIASNIMSGFGIEAGESARVADVLAQTMRSANVDLTMLGESMKYAAPLASAAGWSFEETAAAIGFLGNAGIQGSAAGTGLNSALATLADTSSAGAQKLSAFGVAATDSSGQVRPLVDIVEDLADQGADVADVIGIFGLEAGPKLQALIGQGADGLRELTADLEASQGVAQQMADIRMEGAVGAAKELSSAFEGLMIAIAESGLLEAFTGVVQRLTAFVQSLTQTNPALLRTITIVAGAAAAVGPLVLVIGKLMSIGAGAVQMLGKVGGTIGRMLGPVSGLGGAVGGLGGMLRMLLGPVGIIISLFAMAFTQSEEFRNAILGLLSTFGELIGQVVSAVMPIFQQLLDALIPIVTTLADALVPVIELVAQLMQWWMTNVLLPIVEFLLGVLVGAFTVASSVIQTALEAAGTVISWLGSVAKAVWDAIVTAVGWLRDRVVGAWDAIVAGVRTALDWVKGKWDWLQDKLSTIVGKIKDFLGGIWDGLKSGAKAAANAAIRIVNGIIGGINTVIDGINLLPGVSIPHIPRIPQLAKGGVVTRPTLAMVGEGNESEAVLPLSKLDAMLSNDRGAGDRPLVVENHIEIGGEVVRVVEQYVNERDRTLTRRVLAGVGGAR